MAKKNKIRVKKDKIYFFETPGRTGIVQGISKKDATKAVRNRFSLPDDVAIELRKRGNKMKGMSHVLHHADRVANITKMGPGVTGPGGETRPSNDAGSSQVESQA